MSDVAPKISICIPTYNRSSYLKMCLNSVLSSEYGNLEVIVSDNASQDNTTEIVNSFSDKRLKYIRNEKNIGAELNILNLIKNSTGDFIFFLTDDDILNEIAIPKTIQILQKYPDVGVIMSKMNILDDATNELQEDYTFHDTDVLFKHGEDALLGLFNAAHVLSRIAIKRDLIDVQGVKKHIGRLFPQMYFVGYAVKKAHAFYTDTALVTHRVENITYWDLTEYDRTRGIIEIIKDITDNENYGQRVKNKLINRMIRRSYGPLLSERKNSIRGYFKFISTFVQIPEFKTSILFWMYVIVVLCMGSRVKMFSSVTSYLRRRRWL